MHTQPAALKKLWFDSMTKLDWESQPTISSEVLSAPGKIHALKHNQPSKEGGEEFCDRSHCALFTAAHIFHQCFCQRWMQNSTKETSLKWLRTTDKAGRRKWKCRRELGVCSSSMTHQGTEWERWLKHCLIFFPKLDFVHIYINMHAFMSQDGRLTSLLKKLTGMILSQC